ncbi:hypothetical protein FOZ61_008978, partial [Perkinsus olseni]
MNFSWADDGTIDTLDMEGIHQLLQHRIVIREDDLSPLNFIVSTSTLTKDADSSVTVLEVNTEGSTEEVATVLSSKLLARGGTSRSSCCGLSSRYTCGRGSSRRSCSGLSCRNSCRRHRRCGGSCYLRRGSRSSSC